MSDSMGLSSRQRFVKFSANLTGPASHPYYTTISLGNFVSDYKGLKGAFLDRFEDSKLTYRLMHRRVQEKDKDVRSYILTKVQLCKSYNEDMPDEELMRLVKMGLKPELVVP